MKKIVFLSCFILIGSQAFSQLASITVTIKDFRNENGSVLVGVYTSKNDFLKKTSLRKAVKIKSPEVTVSFDDLPPGEYAVSIIHDENDNKEFDRNKIGLPKEGYCFGNNALGRIGTPSYDQVKIVLKGESVSQILKMKYL